MRCDVMCVVCSGRCWSQNSFRRVTMLAPLRRCGVFVLTVHRTCSYVSLAALLSLPKFKSMHATQDDVENVRRNACVESVWVLALADVRCGGVVQVVNSSEKQRFQLSEEGGVRLIRATQGHSIKSIESDALLTEIKEKDAAKYPVCLHGSYQQYWVGAAFSLSQRLCSRTLIVAIAGAHS